jgi:hypothetical protein
MDKASKQIDKTQYETYITLAGGHIRCLRCTAQSVRSGEQCGKPAMKSSKTQKCTHHGGRSTGATTAEGKQRIIDAHLKHGDSTRAARVEHSKASAHISMLEDCLYVLGMTTEKRLQGRKASGYRPLRTVDDVRRFILETRLHSVYGVV